MSDYSADFTYGVLFALRNSDFVLSELPEVPEYQSQATETDIVVFRANITGCGKGKLIKSINKCSYQNGLVYNGCVHRN